MLTPPPRNWFNSPRTYRNEYAKISGVDWLKRMWILAQSEPDRFCVGGG